MFQQATTKFNSTVQGLMKNKYFSGALTIFLILYAGMARPQLPKFIADLFQSAIFRLAVLVLIAYMSTQDLQMAVMIAVAFSVTMNLLNEQLIAEGFMDGIQEHLATDTESSDSDTTDQDIASLDSSSE